MSEYANIIIDISVESLDRPFTYHIPEALRSEVDVGCAVLIPFGKANTKRTGYVIALTDTVGFNPALIKDIISVSKNKVDIEGQLLSLAWWMKNRYSSTMNQALKTVMPVKSVVKSLQNSTIELTVSKEEALEFIAQKKCGAAQKRLLEALIKDKEIPLSVLDDRLNVHASTITTLVNKGMIKKNTSTLLRNPLDGLSQTGNKPELNDEQTKAVSDIWEDHNKGINSTWLLHGITGSGKTEVYLEIIERVIAEGKQVIVLIPEISLTYQTVMRFYRRFGSRVSIVNSRLSQGERYDQFLRAKKGDIDIMIGPRSALFTPFKNLGLIVIDEEHEESYNSENAPRYLGREVAIHRAQMAGGFVILGSATPSVESTYLASKGIYKKAVLNKRGVTGSNLAKVTTVDLREEMKAGNRSICSRILHDMIEDRLQRGEQIMLFLNRRGYSNFISCRSCGKAIMCPNCDISMTYHEDGRLKCHYCGHTGAVPSKCPQCESKFLAGLGMGTEKAQTLIQKEFPRARILRMDMDTTAAKGSHEKILESFMNHEADILLGTQMIVKGHDFPSVTLVGILVADKSLYASTYKASEKTFQLLTQAAGRAGRGERSGDVIIQTYRPDHYAISCAASQDYSRFYEREISFRLSSGYPPVNRMLSLLIECPSERVADAAVDQCACLIRDVFNNSVRMTGPSPDSIGRINNLYRRVLFVRSGDINMLFDIQKMLEKNITEEKYKGIILQIDIN